jgi:signal transduction histidine kinase
MFSSVGQHLQFENYTILIIDDSTANLGVVFEYLDDLGFELMIAQDGESGLAKAQYEQPDIILLDAIMPGVDGFEVCRALKQNEITKSIPVIFMTGLTGVEDTVQGFEAGAVDYITKPIRKRELVARLVNHLSIHSLTQQLQQEIKDRESAAQALLDYQDKLEEIVEQRTHELTDANSALRSLATRLTDVEEIERQRLARELHDRVGQDLGLLDVQLNIIKQELPAELARQLASRFDDMLSLVSRVATHVYDVTSELRSPVLEEYGIIAALNGYGSKFTQRTGVRVIVTGDEKAKRPSRTVENTLLRISQEALANIAKYAHASLVTITVEQVAKSLRLTIQDDGVGFVVEEWQTPTDEGRGWGILSMRERAESINGRLEITSKASGGTRIFVEVFR